LPIQTYRVIVVTPDGGWPLRVSNMIA
jgi:hypothetical protein